MTLVRAGEGQHELLVREVALEGGPLSEEPFIREGEGSAFVSRPNVIVFVTSTERGLAALPKKVEQLIGRGFHHMALELPGVDRLDGGAWEHLRSALAYTDQFAGWLALCGLSAAARQAVDAAAARDGAQSLVQHVADRGGAIAALRRLQDGEADPLVVQSGDELLESGDTSGGDDDWGDWGDEPREKDSGRLPPVDVAEMLVEADELARLRDQLQVALKRGRKYFTVRLHFERGRKMTSDDMHALVTARDAVARAQGQLVLAALQDDVLKWLRLLGEDRHFTIVDSADDAEQLHRRHAAGEVVTPPPSEPAAAFSVVAKDGRTVAIRAAGGGKGQPVTAPVRVITLGRDGLTGLPARVKQVVGEGVRDLVADLGRFKEIRGESFDALPRALEAATKAGARLTFGNVSREVRALLKILGVAEGGEGGTTALADSLDGALLRLAATRPVADEVRFELTSEALDAPPPLDPVSSVEIDEEPALGVGAVGGLADEALRASLARAEAEADQARRRAAEAEGKLEATARRVSELEAAARRVPELEQAKARAERALEEQRGSGRAEAERLAQRVQALERDLDARRARIAELELALQAGDAQVDEVRRDAEGRARDLEQELERLRVRAQELEAGAGRVQELEQALAARDVRVHELERRARELEEAASRERAAAERERAEAARLRTAAGTAGEDALRAQALEADLAARDRELDSLQEELARLRGEAARAPAANGGAASASRVAELERENARILAEAEQEIQRLLKEQALLREELESAGEMIERLGKELEFS